MALDLDLDPLDEKSDPLCRFYTHPAVGDLLVKLMGQCSPRRVVDLGAGDGSLSAAASTRWRRAEIVTVDMDESCTSALRQQLSALRTRRHVHVKIDALESSLPAKLLNGQCGFDAAICNPPYLLPRWRSDYERIIAEAGLAEVYGSMADVSLDALFLAQNLRLTRPGGRIGFIIPDGLATGKRAALLRRFLLSRHKIECVVQLPLSSFRNTEAQAYILVFAKAERSPDVIRLYPYPAEAGCLTVAGRRRTRAAPAGITPAVSWS